jgi:hypothetical protein
MLLPIGKACWSDCGRAGAIGSSRMRLEQARRSQEERTGHHSDRMTSTYAGGFQRHKKAPDQYRMSQSPDSDNLEQSSSRWTR